MAERSGGAETPTPSSSSAVVWMLRIVAAEVCVLALTGVYLVLFYRPSASQAWHDIYRLKTSITFGQVVRVVHRWTAGLLLVSLVGLAVMVIVDRVERRGPPWRVALVAVAPLALFTSFTGYLLPWDQLALSAVTAGTDVMGYQPLFGRQVQFVLFHGRVVQASTVLWWLLVHLVMGSMITASVVASRVRSVRASVARRGGGAVSPQDHGIRPVLDDE